MPTKTSLKIKFADEMASLVFQDQLALMKYCKFGNKPNINGKSADKPTVWGCGTPPPIAMPLLKRSTAFRKDNVYYQ